MDNISQILGEVEAFSAIHGVKPETVVRNATGNPRLYERLRARAERTERDLQKIREYMASSETATHGGAK